MVGIGAKLVIIYSVCSLILMFLLFNSLKIPFLFVFKYYCYLFIYKNIFVMHFVTASFHYSGATGKGHVYLNFLNLAVAGFTLDLVVILVGCRGDVGSLI